MKIAMQNIGGIKLGNSNKVGGIITTRCRMNFLKPDFLCLTETRIENRSFNANWVLSKYRCSQLASSGERRGGVLILAKREINYIENSVFNCEEGWFTIGIAIYKGRKTMVVGVYGPPDGTDGKALGVLKELDAKMEEMQTIFSPQHIIMMGDFNLHLDRLHDKPIKKKSCLFLQSMIDKFELYDLGEASKEETWRRPGRSHKKSRIDYFFVSSSLSNTGLRRRWHRNDHAELSVSLNVTNGEGDGGATNFRLKDWVFLNENFQTEALRVIEDTVLDHSLEMRRLDKFQRLEKLEGKNISQVENDISVVEPEEGVFHAHVIQIVLSKLTMLQKRTQITLARERREKLEELQGKLNLAYQRADRWAGGEGGGGDPQADIEELKLQIGAEAEKLERARVTGIQNFILDSHGKCRAETFSVIKEPKFHRNLSGFCVDGKEINEPAEMCEIMKTKYQSTTSSVFVPEMSLNQFFNKYGVQMDLLPEHERGALEEEFSLDELRTVLTKCKMTSSPGPTQQTPAIFKFLFAVIPNILIRALNELTFYTGLARANSFKWMFHRQIVYIPKPGKKGQSPAEFRPISLLEVFYKLQTRMLANRLTRVLPLVISPLQHGFVPQRSCQTAALPLLEAIFDAQKHNKPLQILFVDIASAFDSISPFTIRENMFACGLPPIFVEATHGLTYKGTGRVLFQGQQSESFDIANGSGQGDPLSAPRFDIGIDPSIRALEKVLAKYSYVLEDGTVALPAGFADDLRGCLAISGGQQLLEILEVFRDFGKVSGLQINLAKTELLHINTPDGLVEQIRSLTGISMVNKARYLGLQIGKSVGESKTLSIQHAKEVIENKVAKIQGRKLSLFHKRLLLNMAVLPTFNHICMVFGPDADFNEWYEGIVVKALWYRNKQGLELRGRHLVARERFFASHTLGGLQLIAADVMAKGLVLNLFRKLMGGEGSEALRSFYQGIFDRFSYPTVGQMLQGYGPHLWREAGARVGTSSFFLKIVCQAMASFLASNEKSSEGWRVAAIAGHSLATGLLRFSRMEGDILKENGIYMVQDLFGVNDLTGKLVTSSDRDYGQNQSMSGALISKCKQLRRLLQVSGGDIYRANGDMLVISQGQKFSKVFRNMFRAQTDKSFEAPPAYLSRQREGYALPRVAKFMQGYTRVLTADVPSKYKELGFLIMNRQVWTSVKQSATDRHRGENSVDTCMLCGEKETTFHMLLECEKYALRIWQLFEEVVNRAFREGSHFNGLRMRIGAFQILYGQSIVGASGSLDKAIFRSILHTLHWLYSKRTLRLTGSINPGMRLTDNRLKGHLILIQDKIISLLNFQNKNADLHEQIRQTLVDAL